MAVDKKGNGLNNGSRQERERVQLLNKVLWENNEKRKHSNDGKVKSSVISGKGKKKKYICIIYMYLCENRCGSEGSMKPLELHRACLEPSGPQEIGNMPDWTCIFCALKNNPHFYYRFQIQPEGSRFQKKGG